MNILNFPKSLLSTVYKWYITAPLIQKIVMVLIIGFISWFSIVKLTNNKPKTQYQTAQVERGSIISTVSESGNVSAVGQTSISSPSNGIIEEIYVKNGDMVSVGQSLFKVRSTASDQEKSSAYASYLSAVNNANTAQQNKISLQAQLEDARKAVLDAQNAVDSMNNNRNNGQNNPTTKQPYTQNEIDSIVSNLTSAKENFTAIEKKYTQVNTSISAASAGQNSAWLGYQATQDSEVKSPVTGTVANLSMVTGSQVSTTSGASTNSSTNSSTTNNSPIMVIGDFSNLNIKSQVNEIDISKIYEGQKATITLDAFPDQTFVGSVSSVDTVGSSSSSVVTYNVYITFIAPPPHILPGMSASATIQIDRKDNTLYIPTTAVQTSTDGSNYIRMLKNNQITQVPVEIGIASDTDTEILSGLSEGDTVVTSIVTQNRSGNSQTASPFSGFGGRGGFGGGTVINRGSR